MKWRETLCLVLVAATGASAAAQRVESDQQALIKLERDWNDAFYKKDVAFIESILAPEFTATYDDGSRGEEAKELGLRKELNQQVESAAQDDFTVKIFGNTAVVFFTLKLVGIKKGQRWELGLSYTDIWVLRDGRWLCVSTQSTRVNSK